MLTVSTRSLLLALWLMPLGCHSSGRSNGTPDGAVDAMVDRSADADVPGDAPSDTPFDLPAEAVVDAGPPPAPICLPSGWCWQNPLPMGAAIDGAWGTSADDVWAVGSGGTILHWDGTAWSFFDSGTTETLSDVWGSGASDIWAVGGYLTAVMVHWDGNAWSKMNVMGAGLQHLWGSGSNDVWAVGWSGWIQLASRSIRIYTRRWIARKRRNMRMERSCRRFNRDMCITGGCYAQRWYV